MKGGFSFCGVDIANIGLEYAPELSQTYVYAPAETNVHEEIFESHDGGYIYGSSKKPKEINLRCFFEEKEIDRGVLAKAYDLFRIGKSGKLIFKRRPWCYYYVTVTKVDGSGITNYLNGIFVITVKAYYPYARGIGIEDEDNIRMLSNLRNDPEHSRAMQNTALLDIDVEMPTTFTNLSDSQRGHDIILYNPGTELAKVSLEINCSSEISSGVTIVNNTTGQICHYHAIVNDKTVYTDGISGKTYVYNEFDEKEIAFLYHDYGFIDLAPAYPILRDVYAKGNGDTIKTSNRLYQDESEKEWYKNKYICIDNKWFKIRECIDKNNLKLDSKTITTKRYYRTCVVLMNELHITPDTGTKINKISFIYKPTYA